MLNEPYNIAGEENYIHIRNSTVLSEYLDDKR